MRCSIRIPTTRSSAEVMSDSGLLDTNVVILWDQLAVDDLPRAAAISAVTLAELAAGIHAAIDAEERARRVELLQRVESSFDPIPFDTAAARSYGRITAAVRASGRSPRARVADQMIAATAAARGLPLHTTNVNDFIGLEGILTVVSVRKPQ